MIEAKDLNKQSAAGIVDDVHQLLDEQRKALADATQLIDENNYKQKYEDSNKTIESLKNALADKDKLIREYQDLNQKLFLRTGGSIDNKMVNIPKVEEPQQDPLVQQALAKIEAYNNSIK